MQLDFLGATGTVTGSKYLLTIDNHRILIDCGLFQGLKELRLRNWTPLPIDPATIEMVILTHAHIDHSGYLPLLYRNGFRGKVYASTGTRDLCEILLPDSAYLQEEEAAYANLHGYSKHRPALPLYTVQDAKAVLHQFVTASFHEVIELFPGCTFEFLPAGHIIGASLVRLCYQNKSIVFTGDMGRKKDWVMNPPTLIHEADYVVMESTYGNRSHAATHPSDELAEVVNRTIARGGSLVIPAFAVGRAQSLLYYFYLLKKEKRIPDVPIFLDSPMAISATHVFMHHRAEHRLSREEIEGMASVAAYVNTPIDSKKIDEYDRPLIVISASGMVTGGRILHHVKAFASNPKNTILFTGYQAVETRGARILNGEHIVKMLGEMVPIHAEVASLQNMSAHADADEMVDWLSHFKREPKKIFITHGEPEAAASLKRKIEVTLHFKHCLVPAYLQRERL